MPSGLIEDQHGMSAGAICVAISARCKVIASVLQWGRTRAAPLPSLDRWRRKYRWRPCADRAALKAAFRASPNAA